MKKCAWWMLFCAVTTWAGFAPALFAQSDKKPAKPAAKTHPAKPTPAATHAPVEKGKMPSAAMNHFGLKLVADLAAHDRHKNLFVSPLSVFLALSMTESGAQGETRKAMRQTLVVPADMSEETLHQSAADLMKSLQSQKGIELAIANALWADQRFPFSEDFVARSRNFYQADATALDFSKSQAAADTINGWVKKNTRDKIPSIVSADIVAQSKAVLTNAVYFRGRWEHQFSKSDTKDEPFHLHGGAQKKVAMMHRGGLKSAYRSGKGFEAAALPYESSEVELYAILPAPGHSPEDALAAISVEQLRVSAEPNELDLKFPRFTLDFGPANLKDPLTRMGMGVAFQDKHEFAPMGSPLFYIGSVLHRTRLEIDEEGTVAAAATAITMRATAARPQVLPKKILVFDRPFALLLCDTQSGAILFTGVIYDPGQ